MKIKQILTTLLIFLSTASLSETYVCSQELSRFGRSGEIETITLERDGSYFMGAVYQLEIVYESESNLILTSLIGSLPPSLLIFYINKDTKEWGQSIHDMDEYKINPPRPSSYGKCVVVN